MTTKSKKTIKAYLWFWEGETKPDIYFEKPTENDKKLIRDHNIKVFPCEIIYEDDK